MLLDQAARGGEGRTRLQVPDPARMSQHDRNLARLGLSKTIQSVNLVPAFAREVSGDAKGEKRRFGNCVRAVCSIKR